MVESDTKKLLQNLLDSQKLAVLATESQNTPYTNLIAFSTHTNFKELLFGTYRHTTKYRNITKNQKVSMLFDNRKNLITDFSQTCTVTAIGTAHEVEKQQYQDRLLAKHPQLDTFIKNKDCALIRVRVDKYIIVENFQQKEILIL